MAQKYIKIKELEIPINIKNYPNSKSVKVYFKGNVLNVTKPTRLSTKRMLEILKVEEQNLYDKYKKIVSSEVKSVKQWENEEKIFYKGKEFLQDIFSAADSHNSAAACGAYGKYGRQHNARNVFGAGVVGCDAGKSDTVRASAGGSRHRHGDRSACVAVLG